jgi:hypothetical protein
VGLALAAGGRFADGRRLLGGDCACDQIEAVDVAGLS